MSSITPPVTSPITKERKLELIHRALGLRHKLKVHESTKLPDTHDELALAMLGKWELEDELRAIEGYLEEIRDEEVASRRRALEHQDNPKRRA